MKIKSKNPKIASMKLCVPVDGTITIDGNGVADVSVKCATILVKGTNDWDYLKKETAPVVDNDDEEDDTEDSTDGASDRETFELGLKDMKLEDMKAMAKEAEYPEEEWAKLISKKLMTAYLLKKFDEVTEK